MPKKTNLYRALKAQMALAGYNQTDLAARAKMTTAQICARMTGSVPWGVEECYRVCNALNIPLSAIADYWPVGGVDAKGVSREIKIA